MKKSDDTVGILRWLFLGLVLATTAAAMSRLWNILRIDGLGWLEATYLFLVCILFAWISASFWIAALGAYARWQHLSDGTLRWPNPRDAARPIASRTALLFPLRNEETARILIGIEVIRNSIIRSGHGDIFDIYILSDSNDPERILSETEAWQSLQDEYAPNIFYRHREDNSGKKAGNIAEFCRNWGAHYDYMIVLDADSLMTGDTLTGLVRLMDNNPRAAIIQATPQLVGRDSLFARIQQFSSSVYGAIYATGLSLLQGPGGNYWGHNAIIRVKPFMAHCGLPALAGSAPLGGEIMSHDFVEAALLRRAGWNLHLVTDLEGSYEEPPPTLIDHLIRDRRWCQGNLQHMRLIFAQGFTTESRGHFINGVMSYLASPLWLIMLLFSVAVLIDQPDIAPVLYVGRYPHLALGTSHALDYVILVLAMVVLLYGPKFLGLALVLRDPEARKAHGGAIGATVSVIAEAIYSTLLAPIAMLSQSAFVVRILLGETKGWGAQFRDERRLSTAVIARAFAFHTLIGIGAAVALYLFLPDSIWWFVPLLVGPIVSIVLVRITSSVRAGLIFKKLGLFVIPAETGQVPIVEEVRARLGQTRLTAA